MTEFTLFHASLNTFMSDSKNVEDVENLLEFRALLYTLTETADESMVKAIRSAVNARGGYRVVNPDPGDILFILSKKCDLRSSGGPLAIPAVPIPARDGGHGPRHNSYIEFSYEKEIITHTGVHFVTAKSKAGPRIDQQVHQSELLGKQMQRFGKGRRLATGSGDLNAELPTNKAIQECFDEYKLTTTAEETGNMTDTVDNRRIDYIWTYDQDKRLSVASMKVYKGRHFNSDHDAVSALITVKD